MSLLYLINNLKLLYKIKKKIIITFSYPFNLYPIHNLKLKKKLVYIKKSTFIENTNLAIKKKHIKLHFTWTHAFALGYYQVDKYPIIWGRWDICPLHLYVSSTFDKYL